MIRTIIIDDEPSAINVLTLILRKKCSDDVEIIGTSMDPFEGRDMINRLKPDLAFLDVEMPGLTGIDMLRSIEFATFRVIFVTAYDAYAVEAFQLSALDYLLKPVESEGVARAVEKIKLEMAHQQYSFHARLEKLEQLMTVNVNKEPKVAIGMTDKILFLSVADIIYCEADGAYTQVFTRDGKKVYSSKSLGEFEGQLQPYSFFRIHHRYLINLNSIREFQRYDSGYVIMDNSQKLEVSHRKRKEFLHAIKDMLI